MNNNANAIIGQAIRQLRESSRYSQEKLAEKAGITYQYLSSLENGKENFSIGILESIAQALGLRLDALVERSYADQRPVPMVKDDYFIPGATLPPVLTQAHIQAALNETHKIMRLVNAALLKSVERPLSAYIQGNNFSGIVSNILTDSFSRFTPYKHHHGQRYPDLICRSANGDLVGGLEVKSTIQQGKGGESHNGHSGWHVIACFSIDKDNGDIQFIHVMLADLVGVGKRRADWKYVGSKVNRKTGSQRTETYNTTSRGTAKLRHGTVYLDRSVVDISRWRTDLSVPTPLCSPFKPKDKKPIIKKRAKRT
jgi:transcriptional regulator with XRE-family HTH domain